MNPNENMSKFTSGNQAPAEIIKELIFQISCKIDEMVIQMRQLESSQRQPRSVSQESGDQVNYGVRTSSPSTQMGLAPTQLFNNKTPADKTNPFMGRGGLATAHSHDNFYMSQYASTTDMTLVLDEREKRLQVKEELVKCKEQIISLTN